MFRAGQYNALTPETYLKMRVKVIVKCIVNKKDGDQHIILKIKLQQKLNTGGPMNAGHVDGGVSLKPNIAHNSHCTH